MSTTGEQVQVTPELLEAIESNATLAPAARQRICDRYGADITICGHPAHLVVSALVARIRELENEVEGLENEMRSLVATQGL